MAGTGGGDPWRITGEDRAKHDAQFFQLKPVNGFVTGEQARGFFMQSGLQTSVLGQIWTLADMNSDGKMDKKEFSIAMHLIKKKLQGYELPKVLPPSLKADPSPMMGSFGTMSGPAMGMPVGSTGAGMGMSMGMPVIGTMAPTSMVGSSMTMPIMANGVTPVMGQPGYMGTSMMRAPTVVDNKPRAGSFGTLPQTSSQSYYTMPHQSKLKYTQMFNSNDRHKRGHLTGVEARALLVQSGLPQPLLAQIWTLSDVDKDGKLTCDEFCIAMHLVDLAKSGRGLPQTLPPELLNEFKGRSDSFGKAAPPQPQPGPQKDAFGDLLGGMGMPMTPAQAPAQEEEKVEDPLKLQVTFEDKRKENFDKGQAELDRRRQMLQEQLQQENQARLEKERQEQEKRERVRQEQERKRLQELERQMEKQRQIEREKEEQRQKMLEQREAARREIERQRQMDWERQRKEQLLSEKGREYEQLGAIKSQASNLNCEFESLQGKKTEIGQKIEQVRNGVTEFTSSIEAMRITRDTKLAEIDKLQQELKDMTQKFTHQQREREQLNLKVQTTIQSNPLSDTHRTVLHSVELKKTTIQRLKKDLEQIEQETESKLLEIDNNNTEISKLNARISELQNNLIASQKAQSSQKQTAEDIKKKQEKERQEKLRKEFEAQRKKEEIEQKQKEANESKSVFNKEQEPQNAWFDFGSQNKTSTASEDIWTSAFGSVSQSDQNDIWSSSNSTTNQTNKDDIWSSGQKTDQSDKKDIWSNAFSSQSVEKPSQVFNNKKKKQYKAIFQFDARNPDELSFVPDDIIWVSVEQTGAEPGWFSGELNGKSGFFPQAYVEEVSDQSSQFTNDAFSGTSSVQDSFPDKGLDNLRSTESPFNSEVSPSPTPGQGQTAPDGLQAQALYPWKAKKDNHLTFNKGDIILVKEQQEMWWSGEINGKIGWFPKSYVKLIAGPASSSKTSSRAETPIGTLERNEGSSRSTPQLEESNEGEYYVAAYNYTSAESGDLNFNQGDVILVTKSESDWWTGSLAGQTGIFPANYVKKMEGQQKETTGSSTVTTSTAEVPSPVPAVNTLTTTSVEGDGAVNVINATNMASVLTKDAENFSSLSLTNSDFDSVTNTPDVLSTNTDLFANFDFSNTNMAKSEETQVNFFIGDELNASCRIPSMAPSDKTSITEKDLSHSQPIQKEDVSPISAGKGDINALNFDTDPFSSFSFDTSDKQNVDFDVFTDSFGSSDTGKNTLSPDSEADPFSSLMPDSDGNSGASGEKESKKNDSDLFGSLPSATTGVKNEGIKPDTDLFGITTSSTTEKQKESNFDMDLNCPLSAVTEGKNESTKLDSDPFSSLSTGDKKSEIQFKNDLISSHSSGTTNEKNEPVKFDIDPFSPLPSATPEKNESTKFEEDLFSSLSTDATKQKNEFTNFDQGIFSSKSPANNGEKNEPGKYDQDLFSSLSAATTGEKTEQAKFDKDLFSSRTPATTGEKTEQEKFGKDLFSSIPPATTGEKTGQEKFDQDIISSLSPNVAGEKTESAKFDKDLFTPLSPATTGEGIGPARSDEDLFSSLSPATPGERNELAKFDTDAVSSLSFGNSNSVNQTVTFNPESCSKVQLSSLDSKTEENSVIQQDKDVTEGGTNVEGEDDDVYEDVEYNIYEEIEYKMDSKNKISDKTKPSEPSQKSLKKPEIATVIAPYTATGPEQLSLSPGQLIQVRKKSPSGWWEGELQARGQKKKIGWFPANYVKLLGSSSTRSTPDTMLQSNSQSSSPATTLNRTATPTMPPPQRTTPQPAQDKYVDQVMALYPYIAQHEDELTFHKDTVINVINKDDPNWWHGEQNGKSGVFPSNYVGPLTMSPPQENTWSTDPAVLAQTSAKESKRQNYIHELINTEETYMSDMSIVLEAFYSPMAEAKVMTEEELNSVFVNWKQLIQCNRKLLKALRVRKTMCGEGQVIQIIGDILCENIPHMTPYIRFCSVQLSAAALIQHKTENSPEFKEVQKVCTQNPKTKGMPLSSFLLKPMQRITKYPLMIEKLLQYTPEDHPDNQNLTDALSKAEELCSQVNEGVRERENSNRLEWIQSHVQCDGLPEKITFNSVTNCLGPRKLVYSGTLYKIKSNKELVGMLFNDFLLLTQPLSSSTSAFVFDPKAKTQYKMYKMPIFLNEVAVKKPSDEEADPCQFHLSHIDRVFNLKATNQTERDNWVKHLEAASRHYLDTERKKREKAYSSEQKIGSVGRLLVMICEGINLTTTDGNVRRSGGVGRLLVVIVEGSDLIPSDENGKSDPYCEVSMGAQEHKTKVINATLNPKWNSSMQFTIKDLEQDVLCITVFDRDIFTPNDFLGRTEVRVKEIYDETRHKRGPIQKRLLLHEVKTGEVLVKLDLQLYENT